MRTTVHTVMARTAIALAATASLPAMAQSNAELLQELPHRLRRRHLPRRPANGA